MDIDHPFSDHCPACDLLSLKIYHEHSQIVLQVWELNRDGLFDERVFTCDCEKFGLALRHQKFQINALIDLAFAGKIVFL